MFLDDNLEVPTSKNLHFETSIFRLCKLSADREILCDRTGAFHQCPVDSGCQCAQQGIFRASLVSSYCHLVLVVFQAPRS
jgi:hypothetical protein